MSVPFSGKKDLSPCRGFSVLDLLIAAVVILIVVSFSVTSVVRGQKPVLRTNAARQFANYLQQARDDSMRRRATAPSQMAQVTIINERYYSVSIDANGDGILDTPIVISLAEKHVTVSGPFPRTAMFDSLGRVVDVNANVMSTAPTTFANSSGTSLVKLSDAGQPSVVQP